MPCERRAWLIAANRSRSARRASVPPDADQQSIIPTRATAASRVLICIVIAPDSMNRTRLAASRQVTNVAELPTDWRRRRHLSPVPIQVATIPIQVAILAPQLFSFMARSPVISIIEIAPQFPAVARNLCLIAPDVAPVPPTIFGKHRPRAQSDQQQNSCNHAFHVSFSFRSPHFTIPGVLLHGNRVYRMQTQVPCRSCAARERMARGQTLL